MCHCKSLSNSQLPFLPFLTAFICSIASPSPDVFSFIIFVLFQTFNKPFEMPAWFNRLSVLSYSVKKIYIFSQSVAIFRPLIAVNVYQVFDPNADGRYSGPGDDCLE